LKIRSKFNLSSNLYGCIWMVAAMAFFAVEDTLIKFVTSSVPIGQILMMFGLGGASIFFLIALYNNEKITWVICFHCQCIFGLFLK